MDGTNIGYHDTPRPVPSIIDIERMAIESGIIHIDDDAIESIEKKIEIFKSLEEIEKDEAIIEYLKNLMRVLAHESASENVSLKIAVDAMKMLETNGLDITNIYHKCAIAKEK